MSTSSPGHSQRPFGLSSPFVGRDGELSQLRAALDAAAAGTGQVVLLAGEPGIGKTRTALELASIAGGKGARVLWGRCMEWDGAPSYWPWTQVIRAYLRASDERALRNALGPRAADIAQIDPDLRERWPEAHAGSAIDPEHARFRLFDSLALFIRSAAADRPLLIVLDDAHWADQPSLLLTQFIGQDIGDARVALLVTYRNAPADQHAALSTTLAELSRHAHASRIVLRGITQEETGRFVSLSTGRAPEAELVSVLQRKSGGNPFFVSELLRLMLADNPALDAGSGTHEPPGIPDSVRDLVSRRLARLSEACNDALSVASVIGSEFSLALVARVMERPIGAVLDGLDEAARNRILEADGARGSYRFGHALIQDAIRERLNAATRATLHVNVAAALESLHAADPTPALPEIAYHYRQAFPLGPLDHAFDVTLRAGAVAMEQLAYEDAARQFEGALRILDLLEPVDERRRCDVLLRLGEAQRSAGLREARETFFDAASRARALGLPDRLALAALGLSSNVMLVGLQDRDQLALLREAVEASAGRWGALHARCLAHLAVGIAGGDRLRQMDELRATSDAAVAAARDVGDPEILALALHSRHVCCLHYAQIDEAAEVAAEMEAAAERSGNRELAITATVWRTFETFATGDIVATDVLIGRAGTILEEIRQPYYAYVLTNIKAHRAMTSGRIAEGIGLVEQARRLRQRLAIPGRYTEWWRAALGDFYLCQRGEHERLLDELERVNAHLTSIGEHRYSAMVRAMMAVTLARLGRLEDAREMASDYLQIVEDWPPELMAPIALYPVSHLAETAWLLDDRALAERVYPVLEPYARFNLTTGGNFMSRGSAAHYVGLLATTLERWDIAERQFDDALAMNERMGMLPFAAWTRHACATMLARRGADGDKDRARDLARQALEEARSMEMPFLAEQASALLDRLNPRVPATRARLHGLTPRELEVLRLIADGRVDREIADDLFISPRTVTTHVTSILHKLEASSRSAAVATAIRQGII